MCAHYFFFVFLTELSLLLLLLLLDGDEEWPYKIPLIIGAVSPPPGAAVAGAACGVAGVVVADGVAVAGAFFTTATVVTPQIVQLGTLCKSQTMTRRVRGTPPATTKRRWHALVPHQIISQTTIARIMTSPNADGDRKRIFGAGLECGSSLQ